MIGGTVQSGSDGFPSDVKPDALGQRELRAPVDAAGLPPHDFLKNRQMIDFLVERFSGFEA